MIRTLQGVRLTLTDSRGFGRFFDMTEDEARAVALEVNKILEE